MSDQQPQYQVGDVVNGYRWAGTTWEPVAGQAPPPPPAGGGGQPPKKQKKWYGKWWGIGLIILLCLVVFGAITSGSDDTDTAGTTDQPTNATPAQSADPTEKSTPETSEEPASSEEPSEEPPPEANVYENFGMFDPVKKSSSGDSVVKLGDAADATAAAVKATHSGRSNFAIEVLDSDNQTQDLLVNEIGSYKGTTFLAVNDAAKLKVTADGSWTVTIVPIADLKDVSLPFDGKGDNVVTYSAGAEDWKITHKGQSNFAVQQITGNGQDLLVNEIGNYSGTVPASAGPSIVIIQADGTWAIR